MKQVLFVMLMLASVAAVGQKKQKPNLNKALKAWTDGNLSEAKEIIDAATTYEKTMDDGKTWYYRGLIYASLDTTTNESYASLESEPLKVAIESFNKADEMNSKGDEYFVMDAAIGIKTKATQLEGLANYYLDNGIKEFQDNEDHIASLESLDKAKMVFEKGGMEAYANDTLTYYVAGLVASQVDSADIAIENINKYFDKGGKSRDAYLVLYQIYSQGPHEDKEKSLEVIRKAKAALPDNPDFPKIEIGLLIDLNRIDEAKSGLEEAILAEPDNKILHFYLGYTNVQMDKIEEARKNFENALKIDPEYFDAQFHLANTYLVPVDKTSKELSATGNSPADSKKRSALIQRRVKESETALPYLEKAEKMKAPDKDTEIEVLQKLGLLYYYIADDKNSARIEKKLKDMGVEE